MIQKLKTLNITFILLVIFLVKFLIPGLSFVDCFGALVLLCSIWLEKIVSFHFPKQPNIFNELSLIQSKLVEIQSKSDEQERDLTSIKFAVRNR